MLSFTSLFELALSSSVNDEESNSSSSPTTKVDSSNNPSTSSSMKSNTTNQLTSQDVAKIIERNNQGPEAKAVVNINPSSASEMSKQSANSASSAANRYGNQSANAGQRQSSLTSAYVTKPTKVPGRVNTNPTFSARGI